MSSRDFRTCTLAVFLGLVVTAGCGGSKPPAVTPTAPASGAPGAAPPSLVTSGVSVAQPSKPGEIEPCGDPTTLDKDGKPVQPPLDSPILVNCVEIYAHPDNNTDVDRDTYLYYLTHTKPSRPANNWAPYSEDDILSDYRRLWGTKFLENEWVEVIDDPFKNGVKAKHIVFHIEERQRLKIVHYIGSKVVDQSKIESKLKEKGAELRMDAFIDESTVRQVKGILKDMWAEQGYQYADVNVTTAPYAGDPKEVDLTFDITEGPKVQIKEVQFIGAKAFKNSDLVDQLKDNKPHGMLSFITSAGNYNETKFDDDALRVIQFYNNHGYPFANVGSPELQVLNDSDDKKTRWVRLKIPVDEGLRYRVASISVDGNTVVKTDFLLKTFENLKVGDYFNRQAIDKGFEKIQQVYGAVGYMNFTPRLEARPRPLPGAAGASGAAAAAAGETAAAPAAPPTAATVEAKTLPPGPLVDVIVHINEGKQFFVHRITFLGNTTTHDTVIRREMHLLEGGVFNTEMLKYSIRRLNQLGFFKPLEDNEAVKVEPVKDADNQVDVSIKFQEQNRNQVTFGAGVSQYEGFFGQVGFSTSNFLGRGESLSLSVQQGSQAKNYEVGISEPFLFDRPITAGIDLYTRELIYINQYTQQSSGGTLTVGLPVHPFSRLFSSYSYERVKVFDINSLYVQPSVLESNPFLADSLLIDHGGHRTISKISESVVLHNTITTPLFPMDGKKFTLGTDLAGLGGDTQFVAGNAEAIWYMPITKRISLATREQVSYIRPYGNTKDLPIFEKVFLGGEYSIRGFDLRSVGPTDLATDLVTGGNKSLLFNAELQFAVAGPVRLLAFYDAGQVQDVGVPFRLYDPVRVQLTAPALGPVLTDPSVALTPLTQSLVAPVPMPSEIIGRTSAFKASTGAEVRFFMPVLNVPFRLIFAFNPSRGGVYTNELVPQKFFQIRFAVGTTF